VTSPGERVAALVTDVATFEKVDGDLVLTAVAEGTSVDGVRDVCGWEVAVADDVRVLPAPSAPEVEALRRWDPRGFFLRP
jgi:acyl CoA:acetate/3-ketoacid CoA transferase beta subunit